MNSEVVFHLSGGIIICIHKSKGKGRKYLGYSLYTCYLFSPNTISTSTHHIRIFGEKTMTERKIFVVDFDHTLVHPVNFPYTGRQTWLNKLVLRYVKHMKKQGWTITINTMREYGKGREKAEQMCIDFGIPYDSFNENQPEGIQQWGESRKIFCNKSLDDTQVGFIGWLLRRFG